MPITILESREQIAAPRQPVRVGSGVSTRGTQALARGIQSIGQGAAQALQGYERYRAVQDQAVVQTAAAKLGMAFQEEMEHPERGYRNRRGVDALATRDLVRKRFDDRAIELLNELKTDSQREAFEQVILKQQSAFTEMVDRHASAQAERVAVESYETLVKTTTSQVVGAAESGDLDLIPGAVAELKRAARAQGELAGWTPDQTSAETRRVTTQAHLEVIDSLLSQGNPGGAETYLKLHRDEIDELALKRSKLTDAMSATTKSLEAEALAEELWMTAKDPETGESDPELALAALDEAALSPEGKAEVRGRLLKRTRDQTAARRASDAPRLSLIESRLIEGGTNIQLEADPNFTRLSVEGQATARKLQQSMARTDRREEREIHQLVLAEFGAIWPTEAAQMSDADILRRYANAPRRTRNVIKSRRNSLKMQFDRDQGLSLGEIGQSVRAAAVRMGLKTNETKKFQAYATDRALRWLQSDEARKMGATTVPAHKWQEWMGGWTLWGEEISDGPINDNMYGWEAEKEGYDFQAFPEDEQKVVRQGATGAPPGSRRAIRPDGEQRMIAPGTELPEGWKWADSE